LIYPCAGSRASRPTPDAATSELPRAEKSSLVELAKITKEIEVRLRPKFVGFVTDAVSDAKPVLLLG